MKNPYITLCYTHRLHYVIEKEVRYELPLFLALKLKEYLKARAGKDMTNIVSRWMDNLPLNEQREIKIIPYSSMVA